MQAKRQRFPADKIPEEAKKFAYEMESPFDYNRLLAILEKKKYLFSKEISRLWFKILKENGNFLLFSSLKKPDNLISVDFKEMQEKAKMEYSELKAQYEKLTCVKFGN